MTEGMVGAVVSIGSRDKEREDRECCGRERTGNGGTGDQGCLCEKVEKVWIVLAS